MAYLATHLARFRALLTEGAGVTGYTIPVGHFRLPPSPIDVCEPDAVERSVELRVEESLALGGVTSPLDGRDIRSTVVTVVVGYRYHPEGSLDDLVDARSLGGASADAIQDRASEDAALILGALAWQDSFAGLSPHVIDVEPAGRWSLARGSDRFTLSIPFTLLTRAAYPGSYGPVAT